jgi:magnesium-transporting ATPase (P-type)
MFEQNLELVGATGLLDELQEGVPETLKDLQRASKYFFI